MTDANHADAIEIETIPIERITVLNPRVRDAKKFAEIVDSIRKVGLKQPIKVSRTRGADGEAAYNLICGQGRMEAFQALQQTEIPAIVTDLSEEDSLISSLVENIARSQPLPGELVPGDRRPRPAPLFRRQDRRQDRLFGYSCPDNPPAPESRRGAAADRGGKPERFRWRSPSPSPRRKTTGRRIFSSKPTRTAN